MLADDPMLQELFATLEADLIKEAMAAKDSDTAWAALERARLATSVRQMLCSIASELAG